MREQRVTLEVVDGQQRLRAIWEEFFDGEYPLSKDSEA